jgi:sialate O-acetylesterase
MKTKWLCFLLLLVPTFACAEDVPSLRFARILADHLVLQQEKPITIWGWAEAGAEVEVTFAQQSGEAVAGSGEEAGVTLRYVESSPPPFPARTRKAKAAADGRWSVRFKPARASFQPMQIVARSGAEEVAIRDVLIGEVWVCAGQSNMGWKNFNRKAREVASADFPGLRYVAWEDSWYKPLEDIRRNISWQPCSPASAPNFSAVPYLFGTFLHRYLKVPVGIINVARGGTLGQTWCMRDELDAIGGTIMQHVLKDFDAQCATWDDPRQVEALMKEWEQRCEEAKVEHAAKLKAAEVEGKKPPRLRLPKAPGDARSSWSPPAGLFNATIMPIRDLAPRGVLYYQGENNNFMRWTRYEQTFPRVPTSFRRAFGDADLPFGCISQPGWGTFGLDPELATVAEGYAIVRDIQRRALKDDAHADLIATYPAGNSYIHPGEKWPVAEYASLWALAKVYHQPIVHRGNLYTHMKIDGEKLYLFFDQDPVVHERWKHIEKNASWQVLPQPWQGNAEREGFIIAGKDRRWYPAKARETRLENEWCIELHSDLVKAPVAARYGWANWPTGNLVGRERLPIPTFRTDDWPIPEGVNYTDEAKASSTARLKELKEVATQQAMDRKFRQAVIDLARLEDEMLKGKASERIASKLARMKGILDEFESDPWLSRQLDTYDPEFVEKLKLLRANVHALKKD